MTHIHPSSACQAAAEQVRAVLFSISHLEPRFVCTSPVGQAKSAVLICTDVAARGLDFPDVSTIIQYDVPGASEE